MKNSFEKFLLALLCGALFFFLHRRLLCACFIIILSFFLLSFIANVAVKENSGKSISTIVLPQLTDDLKNDIMERIVSKNLMDMHVAVAPAVSYE